MGVTLGRLDTERSVPGMIERAFGFQDPFGNTNFVIGPVTQP